MNRDCRLPRLLIWLTLLALLAGCSSPRRPDVVLPSATPAPDSATAATGEPTAPDAAVDTLARAAGIPAAAWSAPIGGPAPATGKPEVNYPMIDDGSWQGAPVGGLGAGTIGRTPRGDFARWHLAAGKHRYQTELAAMFSVYARQGDRRLAQALYTGDPGAQLTAWRWRLPPTAGRYYALYPFAWYAYDWSELPVRLVQRQFSPIIPGNYRETSYPVAVFEWTASNPGTQPVTVGLMFTFPNLIGREGAAQPPADLVDRAWQADDAGGRLVGVTLGRATTAPAAAAWDGSFAIAAQAVPGVTVSYQSRFQVDCDGSEVWAPFSASGRLPDGDDATPAGPGRQIGAAIAVTFDLAPGQTLTVPMVLAWDLPIAQFGAPDSAWYRRYTAFFGRDGRNAAAIARSALAGYRAWATQIAAWQAPILGDPARPTWYKTALFNELYYLADGGALWEAGRVAEGAAGGAAGADAGPERIGRFTYLECFDYPFYDTLDVRFYGAWPLAMLWPRLEAETVRTFAATVDAADTRQITVGATGARAPRKVKGILPHDLGAVDGAPWDEPNGYSWQNPTNWKDLNSKFVLQVWRAYLLNGKDQSLLRATWIPVQHALAALLAFDKDGDGIPENDGVPDQTYDTWPASGASAYTGGLWLAALDAAAEMARALQDDQAAALYSGWLAKAQAGYEKLWNGRYYDYDSSRGSAASGIMADQLAGQWSADMLGLPPVLPGEHTRTALQTIYDFNVMRFNAGEWGAVNGMQPDGTVINADMQAQEVWPGVTYALAAEMLHQGLVQQAWQTAFGAYNVVYRQRGYAFRTPEAWDSHGNFRASMYMRPGAIWAIERALTN